MSQTGPFEIGKETVALTSPVNNDTLCIGQPDSVLWNTQFMDNSKVFLEYRTLGQTTWKRISTLGHDAVPGNYVWNVPAMTEGLYQFRASYRLDTSIASAPVIIAITSQGSCTKVAGITGETALSIFPNPAKDIINVHNIPMICDASFVMITDGKGRTVIETLTPIRTTQQSIELSIRDLPNGPYFIHVMCGSTSFSAPFTITR